MELRLRDARTGRWSQRFRAASDLEAAAAFGIEAATRHDVYVGVLPRTRRGGRRADLPETGAVAWVDLDREDAATVLEAADIPAPSLVVASGSPGHRHLYWRLEEPVALDELEDLNMGLAVQLGGDLRAGDAPRILRLAGTLNHKPPTPTPVLIDGGPPTGAAAVRLADLRLLTAPSPTPSPRPRRGPAATPGGERQRARRAAVSAKVRALEAIAPAVYVETLTRQTVPPRSRKVRCPLHEDDTPSLHVYETPEQGWFCFGCRRGGSVYDLAAATLSRQLRGHGFVELQRDLIDLLVDRTAPSPRRR
ncbi:DNA-primase RepB domain-containing protein [Patulibacter brassicae]|uniref:DNA-primase RepB domain-containing protein n=1 Tax=Patulibacter brassicae TaxID=1705717 RepID=A0ABU4VR35_9ACTN|nr:CHC2 zinc finger domain-containing protein [Patulibacter brassicae]MDX8153406.1 DNA-primase RepB domain-containing protein [Patulibacter brassicae]